ncbi:methyltransferase domain-containing protein [Desulfoluna spongiiphila]|uniref:methyltransferase domain-containing protein n=1 Tax=Desulfoluna spongiiphila TaxID=419481 RepID=UPI0012591A48|nr:methyltransferase domain-containing protein [Desulfoluna spongiiphila]VVS91485.1 s-adenosyl-l-methionine-dependent methyltransferase [Desulfoluna spongiiphila]
MQELPLAGDADVEVILRWVSEDACHIERMFIPMMNFWRDIIPDALCRQMECWKAGETLRHAFEPGELLPVRSEALVKTLPRYQVSPPPASHPFGLAPGFFLPRGLASRALGVFPQDIRPMQVLGVTETQVTLDLNHPLAGLALDLGMRHYGVEESNRSMAGRCREVAEAVTGDGPGMQALFQAPDACVDGTPLQRPVGVDDSLFYASPRLVQHLDAEAERQVRALYGRLLCDNSDVLDLMASWDSHLPDSLSACRVTGLGMNGEELERNPLLTSRTLHDLNAQPVLPYDDKAFHAVVCTASVEYAIHPVALFNEVARILKPGGLFVLTFADRWFPPKVTQPWSDMHPFERMGLVLEYFRASGEFTEYHTESRRGWPRPPTDAYFPRKREADPLQAVWARRRPAPGDRT